MICIGGVHGNEPAGVQALEMLFTLLEREQYLHPSLQFSGCLVGLRGNLQALQKGVRLIEKDLNRIWRKTTIAHIQRQSNTHPQAEEKELIDLLQTLHQIVKNYPTDKVYLLDLHTTSAQGGIFSICTEDPESIRLGVELHAPVITGMLRGLAGTILHYFHEQNMGVASVALSFEAGQHQDPLSVNRCLAAILNCMRSIGQIEKNALENRYDDLLIEYSKNLPKVLELLYRHHLEPDDEFKMAPGYRNFDPVARGQLLAMDSHGAVRSPFDGFLLMPLYQNQGNDGFFIVRKLF